MDQVSNLSSLMKLHDLQPLSEKLSLAEKAASHAILLTGHSTLVNIVRPSRDNYSIVACTRNIAGDLGFCTER